MDKPKNINSLNASGKKGFALLITLSVLAVLMALTSVLLGYLDHVRKDAVRTKALIQSNLYYTDIRKIIGEFKDKKVFFNTLYMMPVPLVSSDGRFNLILKCRPLAKGVNINWMEYEDDNNMSEQYNAVEKVFDSIVQNYNLEDPERFKEMILEEINSKKGKFIRKENERLLQKNGIISSRQFKDILEQYQFEVDDPKVSEIPWEKLFVFKKNINIMDGNYLSAELIAILFDMDLSSVKDEWVEGTVELKDFVQKSGKTYNPKLFAEDFLEQAECNVQYTYRDERFAFGFIDNKGEVKDFEFYGKQ